jgi:propionyl-CoA carboxylase alpha chain
MASSACSTLLVANRGEIARRIIASATAMGLRTVAVYAAADAAMPFVAAADRAVALGPGGAGETYLAIERLLDAAARTGADAVHPGYGFLAERADFAAAVIDAGLTWVGPPPAVIEAMGDKVAAKRVAAAAGVPLLPWTDDIGRPETVGFPLLVKAAAGGGGRGMRVVPDASALADALAVCRREASAAFGDDRVFLERYAAGKRHVEVQVLADHHGNVVHLYERDCSLQRRYQKVIEEAPAPGLDPATRQAMGAAAVALSQALDYQSAGTVEFLVDGREFYFLEVNTRLQVEHPVTEAITGIDLVREQLRIARGEPLGYSQGDVAAVGHAVEARLYAEDPAAGYLPSAGRLLAFSPAPEGPAVRVDSGVDAGSVVGTAFDPLLAKLITAAPTRAEAVAALALALERFGVAGVRTNRDQLVAALRDPRFEAGDVATTLLDDLAVPAVDPREALVAATMAGVIRQRQAAAVLASLPAGFRTSTMAPEQVGWQVGGREHLVHHQRRRDGAWTVAVDGVEHAVAVVEVQPDKVRLEIDGVTAAFSVHVDAGVWWVHGPGGAVELHEVPRFPEPATAALAGRAVAPMPGKVVALHVAEGDTVEVGQLLVVVEAMKMEHRLVATEAGTVVAVLVVVGEQVATGQAVCRIE